MNRPVARRGEWAVVLLSVLLGVAFFAYLGNLWPLAQTDLVVPPEELRSQAREFLVSLGQEVDGYVSGSVILIHPDGLDYVESSFGRDRAQQMIARGLPLVYYRVVFKKRGESITYTVTLHPEAGVIGWHKRVDDDYPGARLSVEEARERVLAALDADLGLDPAEFEERSASTTEEIGHRAHHFGFERTISDEPELRERVRFSVEGVEVTGASRRLIVPAEARRRARTAEAPGAVLEMLGFAAVGFFGLVGFVIFLARLRDGTIDLKRASIWPSLVFLCLLGTYALQTANLLYAWDPLWPRWIADLRYSFFQAVGQTWIMVVLLAVVAAGDSVDREIGAGRGKSLWTLARGRVLDPIVAAASIRGFLIGLLCGGVMTLAVLALEQVVGARTAIQPRGFFFYTLNTSAPALTSLLFFFGVALAEELGYRFFAGSWLMARTGKRWLAIALPAVVYGLTHTNLTFLPPAEPFWGRALVLTLVGAVWGWAFLRYDALTVVLSHFTADLFIFNWPRLASGDSKVVTVSAITMCAPLLPAVLWLLLRRFRRSARPAEA